GIEGDTVEEFTEFQQASGVVGGEDAVGCVDEMGDEDRQKFKVGDRVRIVNDKEDAGYYHSHNVGDIGTVIGIDGDVKHDSRKDIGRGTTPYNVEVPGRAAQYLVEVPGRSDQYLAAKDIEKVESVGKDANGDDLYVGDLVTGIEDNVYRLTTDEALMEVVEGTAGGYIRVEGLETYGDRSVVGVDFWVLPERFVKTTEEEFTSKKERPQFDDGDIVIVTQHITNSDGDVASTGTVGIIDNMPIVGSCFIDVGGAMVRVYGIVSGDNHLHKLAL